MNPQISYSLLFLQYEACVAAGLDLWKWVEGAEYTPRFKETVVAWYQKHGQVMLHSEAAVQEKIRREAKKRRRK